MAEKRRHIVSKGKAKPTGDKHHYTITRIHKPPAKETERRYFAYIDEMERLTAAQRRQEARDDWNDFRGRLFHGRNLTEGGIRPIPGFDAKEYPQLPKQLWRRKAKYDLDHYASEFGYSYADDFADFAHALYGNVRNTRQLPEKPKKLPKPKHIRHGRRRVVKITRQAHPTPRAKKESRRRHTAQENARKWVLVRKHTRSCPSR